MKHKQYKHRFWCGIGFTLSFEALIWFLDSMPNSAKGVDMVYSVGLFLGSMFLTSLTIVIAGFGLENYDIPFELPPAKSETP